MTISATTNSVTYTGNGATKDFSYSFPIPETADLVIILTTIATGATQYITTNYSITGVGEPTGGSVHYPTSGSAITSAYTITIQRQLDLVQSTDLENQGPYDPTVVEDALDYLTMLTQQQQEQIDRALAFPVGSGTDTDTLIADILNGATNATAAAASAAAAAASAAAVAAALPISAANLGTGAVTTVKLAANAVTPPKLDPTAIPYGCIMLNGTLVATVAANVLTITLLTKAGVSPSATDPVYVKFRSVTAANADDTTLTITSAMSVTVSNGSMLGVISNSFAFRIWVVMFNDGGTARLGVIGPATARANITGATTTFSIYPLRAWGIASSTAEGGAGAADAEGTFYTTVAVSSKAYATLGWFSWETGLPTKGSWSAGPTRGQLVDITSPFPGQELQTFVSQVPGMTSGATVLPIDNTSPQITEGNAVTSVSITGQSASNLLRVVALGHFAHSAAANIGMALFSNFSTNYGTNAVAAVTQSAVSGQTCQISMDTLFPVEATSAVVYSLRAGCNVGATLTINGSAGAGLFNNTMGSTMRITEIMT